MKVKVNFKYSIGDKVILNSCPQSTVNRYIKHDPNIDYNTVNNNIKLNKTYSIIGYGWIIEEEITPIIFYYLDVNIPNEQYFVSGWDKIYENELTIDNSIKDNKANQKEETYILQDHNKDPLELNDIVYYNPNSCVNNDYKSFISGNIVAFEHFMIATPTLKGGYYLLQNNNCINVKIKTKQHYYYIDDMFFMYRTLPAPKKKYITNDIDISDEQEKDDNINKLKYIQL